MMYGDRDVSLYGVLCCIGCIGGIALPGERDDASKMYCRMRALRSQSNFANPGRGGDRRGLSTLLWCQDAHPMRA